MQKFSFFGKSFELHEVIICYSLFLLLLEDPFQFIVEASSLVDGQKLLEQHLTSNYIFLLTQVVVL